MYGRGHNCFKSSFEEGGRAAPAFQRAAKNAAGRCSSGKAEAPHRTHGALVALLACVPSHSSSHTAYSFNFHLQKSLQPWYDFCSSLLPRLRSVFETISGSLVDRKDNRSNQRQLDNPNGVRTLKRTTSRGFLCLQTSKSIFRVIVVVTGVLTRIIIVAVALLFSSL